MDKHRRAQAHSHPVQSQPPDRRKVQPEGEPNAGRSPAEAGRSKERNGLLAPMQPGQGDPPDPPNNEGVQWGLPASCPVAPRVSQVLSLSSDLRRAMRRLRRELNACQACPVGEDCRFMSYFQGQVNAAITQVNEEWGLP
jgi:hypothetical protein